MKLFILTIILLAASTSFARSPAVLPTVGISIDDYRPTHPKDAKSPGYDFSSAKPKELIKPTNIAQVGNNQFRNISSNNSQNSSTSAPVNGIPVGMTIIILAMPLFILMWLNRKNEFPEQNANGIWKQSSWKEAGQTDRIPQANLPHEDTIDLASHRRKKEEEASKTDSDNDSDIKKAS